MTLVQDDSQRNAKSHLSLDEQAAAHVNIAAPIGIGSDGKIIDGHVVAAILESIIHRLRVYRGEVTDPSSTLQ